MRRTRYAVTGLAVAIALAAMAAPALSHHSFAMYNMAVSKVMTGKLTRFIPGSNHAQLIFEVLNTDGTNVMEKGKPLVWGMETGSAAAMARNGVTVDSFPPGTIMTVTLHPLRDGRPMGAVGGPIVFCGMKMPGGGCNEKTGKVMGAPANWNQESGIRNRQDAAETTTPDMREDPSTSGVCVSDTHSGRSQNQLSFNPFDCQSVLRFAHRGRTVIKGRPSTRPISPAVPPYEPPRLE